MRKRRREQRALAKGRPFILPSDIECRQLNPVDRLRRRDHLIFSNRPTLTPGQIYFMRFIGYQTPREWVIDDAYRLWTRESCKQRFSLRQLFQTYGGLRMRQRTSAPQAA